MLSVISELRVNFIRICCGNLDGFFILSKKCQRKMAIHDKMLRDLKISVFLSNLTVTKFSFIVNMSLTLLKEIYKMLMFFQMK